ncbi:MAG: oligosaccharide flippase family protein, partial [Thermoproteota archaeon]
SRIRAGIAGFLSVVRSLSYQPVIVLIVLDSLLLSVSSLMSNVLLGLGKIKNIAVYGVLSTIVRWLCIIVLLLNGNGLIGLAIGWVMGDSVALLLYSITVTKNVGSKLQVAQKYVAILSDLLKFSWPIYMSSIIHFLYTWYDRVLILTFLTLPDLGVYNVVYQAFSIPILIATSLGSSLLPYYGMAYGAENEEAITFGVRRVSKYSMLIVSPLILGLAATAKPVVTLFAGQQYESGWPVLTLLSLFGLIYGLLPAFSSLLLVYGKTKIILLVNAASIVLSMVFLPLLSTLGLEGLAVMKGVSFLFSFLFSLYFVSKTVRIKFDGKAVLKILASSIVMVLLVTLVQQLAYNKFFLPAYVILGGIVYFLMIRFFKVLNNEDFQLIREIFGERVSKHVGHILGVKP